MTEEEKKAIELVKDFLEQSIINKSDDDFFKSGGWETIDMEYSKAVKVIFELVEKQQKEIEKYKELLNLNIGVDLSYDDYISKEAIREKIEEIEKYEEIARNSIEEKIIVADSDSLNFGRKQAHGKDIEILKELLEK